MDREKVIKGIHQHCEGSMFDRCGECPYYEIDHEPFVCRDMLLDDLSELLKEQEEERRQIISWLGKFCRHIDNGDKWLSDEENIAFFRKKMKQQFGWDSDAINVINAKRRTDKYCKQACSDCDLTLEECRNLLYGR